MKPLSDGCFVNDLNGRSVYFIDFISVEFDLWRVKFNINIAVCFIEFIWI
jgi:hypothetical protein